MRKLENTARDSETQGLIDLGRASVETKGGGPVNKIDFDLQDYRQEPGLLGD
ncbi:hypothetical protein ATDW_36690 (plasmid) [Asticcacaulis sp. DW145]|uniref:hypothetical protein n=1 Tax=Asticcacaulis sp. DW145 TaxID=3095608 RepID=UPI003084FF66|nr:hypothetical protein ATDW_36690 [Asticcacaulis sp. DW145]